MKLTGDIFCGMCVSAANALDNNKAAINALNVFPVPDGDTGINMSLTMSTVCGLDDFHGTVSACAARVAECMLRAARGNSGAILSLFFRGFAKSLTGLDEVDSEDIAAAFLFGTREAYSAVMKPTEGTILTVMRICAERAVEATQKGRFRGDVRGLFDYMLHVADETLANTPELLPLLKQSGVVDAGGSGFVTVLGGMLAALDGNPTRRVEHAPEEPRADFAAFETGDITFAYCTECIVDKDEAHRGEGSAAGFRALLEGVGDSLVFIEDDTLVKIHVHTNHPGRVLEEALTYGALSMVKVENMRAQHSALLEEGTAAQPTPRKPVGFVSVAVGGGVTDAFRDLGVDVVVPGGQTMNPSTDDILDAVRRAGAETVFVLPNNKNIFLVADRAAELAEDCRVVVLPTAQFTEGLSAMMAYDPELDAEANREAMVRAAEGVVTLSVTHAVRDAEVDGLSIRAGQSLGLLNGRVRTAAADPCEALGGLLDALGSPAFLSLYCGADADADRTGAIERMLRDAAPGAEFLRIEGGQPLYDYVVAAEA